eukprot:14351960-Alexandrium_andersonii.AAC.1
MPSDSVALHPPLPADRALRKGSARTPGKEGKYNSNLDKLLSEGGRLARKVPLTGIRKADWIRSCHRRKPAAGRRKPTPRIDPDEAGST